MFGHEIYFFKDDQSKIEKEICNICNENTIVHTIIHKEETPSDNGHLLYKTCFLQISTTGSHDCPYCRQEIVGFRPTNNAIKKDL